MRKISGSLILEPAADGTTREPKLLDYIKVNPRHIAGFLSLARYEFGGKHFTSLHKAKNALRKAYGVTSRRDLIWQEA